MKRFITFVALLFGISQLNAQQVDSIYFHLYTDSLKKGQHNYINVDGKMSNGNWLPLSDKEIQFTCAQASFKGNELFIPEDFKLEKVMVKAVLKTNPAVSREITIWIKRRPDPSLPTKQQIINDMKKNKGKGYATRSAR